MSDWSGLVQVRTPTACFGLIVKDGIVVLCAPYGAVQSMNRNIDEVARYWRSKGAVVKPL
jgi:hypothetical protein